MAVPEQTPYKEYTANGNTTSFALGFICESKNDLIVLVDNVAPPIATWSLVGGNAVFTTAPASGKKIVLQRNTAMSRTTNYQGNNNSFRPETINKDIDRVWLKLQELGVADMLLKIYVDRLHGEQKDYIDNKDQLVRNIITDLLNYVNLQDGSLSSDINNLRTHVNQQDNSLAQSITNLRNDTNQLHNNQKDYIDQQDNNRNSYFENLISRQGVSLQQLDSYYNYLMQRLAQIAVDKGWDASFVVDASGRNQQQINDEVISIFRFGGICDGTLHTAQEWLDSGRFNSFAQLQNAYPSAVSVNDSIDSLALEKAMAKIGNTGHIRLGGKPVFNKDVKFPANANGIQIFANNIIPVKFVHTGNGFDLSLANENVGKNVLRNMYIQGIDPTYQAVDYIDQSQGAGIRVNRAYDNTWENVYVSGFKYGIWLRTGFNNKCVGFCGFVGNQYGVYIDGGATNLNQFDGAKIRLNRKAGVVIDGGTTGPYPTKNTFIGAYIESNVPYSGGYLPAPGDGSHSVGVRLSRTYDNDFTGVYYENQDFDIILENQASDNLFHKGRHGPSSERNCRIWLKGANVNNNDFTASKYASFDRVTPSVISDNANQISNKFDKTKGFNFIRSAFLSYDNTDIQDNTPQAAIHGTPIGAISRRASGLTNNPSEATEGGSIAATIQGIGTASAVLNANGKGEVILGTTINAPTTIVDITGLKAGQIFIIANYQNTHPVTIKSGTDGINGLVLAGRKDCVLAARSDSIMFYVIGLNKIVEMSRSVAASVSGQEIGTWSPIVKGSGGTTIATTAATGRWSRNGRQLTVWFDIAASADLTEPNYYTVTGMPNLPQFAQNGVGQAASTTNPANANQKDVFGVDATTSELRVRVSTQANFSNSDSFAGSATYIIA